MLAIPFMNSSLARSARTAAWPAAHRWLAIATFALFVGCGSDAKEPAAAQPISDSGLVSCAMNPRVDTFAAGIEKAGSQGALKIAISEADPAPPAIGLNNWVIQVHDASGQPVANATIVVIGRCPITATDRRPNRRSRPVLRPGATR